MRRENIVSTAGGVVLSAGGANGAWVIGKEQSLAFAAPSPVLLTRKIWLVLYEDIVSTAGSIVLFAGRADGPGIISKE